MVLMFPSQPLMTRSGWVEIPSALAKKSPSAAREWPWQWAFPATRNYIERETGQKRRHHLHETVLQHAVRPAVLASGTPKRATCHISWTRSLFRRSRDPSRPTLDTPPRRVFGVYTGLSNKRWAGGSDALTSRR